MIIKQQHHALKMLPTVGLSILAAAILSACGGGPIDGKEYGNVSRNASSEAIAANGQTGENSTSTEAQRAAEEEARQKAEEAARLEQEAKERQALEQATQAALAQALAMRDDPVSNPGTKLLVVGLDKSSQVYSNDEWLEQTQFSGLTESQKETMKAAYASLSGADLHRYYRQACPVISLANDTESIYKCIAGIYYGRTKDKNVCFTSIDWQGNVRHINNNSVVRTFKPGTIHDPVTGDITITTATGFTSIAPEFTRVDVGQNMFMVFNGIARSENPAGVQQDLEPTQGYRTQQIVFRFDSAAEMIEIYQKNTDNAWGTGPLEDTCYVNYNGSEKF